MLLPLQISCTSIQVCILYISDQKGISHTRIDDDVIKKARKFKSATSKLVKYLRNPIGKCHDSTTIVDTLKQVYFAKNKISRTIRHIKDR